MAKNTESSPNFVRQLQFHSQDSPVNTSPINNDDSGFIDERTKIRLNDWHDRLLSFPADQDYLLHVSDLSPGEDCPVKVVDLSKCDGSGNVYAPGYIRRLPPPHTWLSPMRIFYSQPTTPWELVDLFGSSITTFDTLENMHESWGDVFKSPIDDVAPVNESNENSLPYATNKIANHLIPMQKAMDDTDHVDLGVEVDKSNENSPSCATENENHSETPTIDFSGNKQSTITEIDTNPSTEKLPEKLLGTATAKPKKVKVFVEAAFLGPRMYMPRMRTTTDPYLHCDGYVYRKSSMTRYLCNRYKHPLLDSEWLTYNQATDIVKYLNEKNKEGKQFKLESCPGVLTIDRTCSDYPSATITTNHICDMPHCKKRVASSDPTNDVQVQPYTGHVLANDQHAESLTLLSISSDPTKNDLDKFVSVERDTSDQKTNVSQGDEIVMHNSTTRSFVQADDRIPVHIISESPEVPWIKPQDIAELKRVFETNKKTLFARLVGGFGGGTNVRLFTPNLISYPQVYALVEKCMKPYIQFVQKQYPALQHIKLAALKSMPGAPSQYSTCNYRLHSDYAASVNSRPPHERPVSLMVALDPFEFIYLKNRTDRRRDLITQTIHKGQAISFTNYCLHAGGENKTSQVCYRIFAYMASDSSDIPSGNVFHYHWKGDGDPEDDVIFHEAVEAESANESTAVSMFGRRIVQSDKFGYESKPPKKKQKANKKVMVKSVDNETMIIDKMSMKVRNFTK
jgi:hypothetical protein